MCGGGGGGGGGGPRVPRTVQCLVYSYSRSMDQLYMQALQYG